MKDWSKQFAGMLVGMAVGDAVGLPREGMSGRRAGRIFGGPPIEHRLILGHGMISDDTEHACMTGQAVLASGGDVEAFAKSLGCRLRGWLLGVPAGIGLATLKSILKLWVGFPPSMSGVWSAGNGPGMRAPMVGVWAAARGMGDAELETWVRAATRITHRDPRAFEGALVIAMAAREAAMRGAEGLAAADLLGRILMRVEGAELREALQKIPDALSKGWMVREFAESGGMKKGVSGYINQTVPAVLYACMRWPADFRRGVEELIACGGDTDTTGAIAGGILGAAGGEEGIPKGWVEGVWEWPRSMGWIRKLAGRLAEASQAEGNGGRLGALPLFWPALPVRNAVFAGIVLTHGFRRLFPPYG